MKPRSIRDVVEMQLCAGCGACASLRPDRLRMGDAVDFGRRPFARDGGVPTDPSAERELLAVCPGVEQAPLRRTPRTGELPGVRAGWGPVRALWEGHAADPEIRFAGSSGGAATALALHALERGGAHAVSHVGARADRPWLNETVLGRDRADLLARTGSRYAPASPCDRLGDIERAPGPCVFIGKPCDCAAVAAVRARRPELDRKLGLVVAFFCAGTPTTRGTLEMLRAMGIDDPDAVESLRYRGNGWPGRATAVVRDAAGGRAERSLSYADSWGAILQKHRQWRCYVCLDHSGEAADVAVGDPWYRDAETGPESGQDPGRSLIVARTERGESAVRAAIRDGYLSAEPVGDWTLAASQPRYEAIRGQVFARTWVCRVMGAAAPRMSGLAAGRYWWTRLTLWDKAQSIVGTVRRVFRKRLNRRVTVREDG